MEAKSIERIAEELGVSLYDLIPLVAARDELQYKAGEQQGIEKGRKEVVDWFNKYRWNESVFSVPYGKPQAQLEEWLKGGKPSSKRG